MAPPQLTPEIQALLSLTPCHAWLSSDDMWAVRNTSRDRLRPVHFLHREASYEQWQAVLTELMA